MHYNWRAIVMFDIKPFIIIIIIIIIIIQVNYA